MHFGLLSRLEYQHFLAPASITKATVKSGQHFAPHKSIALGLKVRHQSLFGASVAPTKIILFVFVDTITEVLL